MPNQVDHPDHYNTHKTEAIDAMEEFFADDPHLFTALKYMIRAKHKGTLVQDLEKAEWYIHRRIQRERFPGLTSKQAQEAEKKGDKPADDDALPVFIKRRTAEEAHK